MDDALKYSNEIDEWIEAESQKLRGDGFISSENTPYLNSTWRGFYTYKNGYGREFENQKGYFDLRLVEINGVLLGKCIETHGLYIKTPIYSKVKGFREKNFVSFHKLYKKANYTNENNLTTESHEVEYEGIYDTIGHKLIGNWRIMHNEKKKTPMSYDEYFYTGTWEATKIN